MKTMNKQLLIISLVLFASCSKSQSWEKGICDCIEMNYNLNEWNYFMDIKSFENEMIKRGKFDGSIDSQTELLINLSTIEHVDFYKHQFSERLLTFGEESIEYCIRRELFNKDCTERHWSEKLIRKLNLHKSQLRKDGNLKLYNEKMANSITNAIKSNKGDYKLKQLFLLQELYRRIPDQAWHNLDQTEMKMRNATEKRKNTIVPHDAIKIYTTAESKLEINEEEYSIDELCGMISEPLMKGKVIHYTGSKKTIYRYHKSVYEKIIECLSKRKNILSQELFNKSYDNLDEEDKIEVDETLKNQIILG